MERIKLMLTGAVILAALVLTALFFYIPGDSRPSFGGSDIHVCLNRDGTVDLDWPEALSPASYRLEVRSGGERLKYEYETPGAILTGVTLPLEIRVQAVAEGTNLLGITRTAASSKLSATVEFVELEAPEAIGAPGPGTLSLTWEKTHGNLYEIFTLEDGVSRHVASTSGTSLSLKVGREGDLAMPSYGEPLKVDVRAGFQGEGYVLCGPASNRVIVERQYLLGDDLNLIVQETEPMHYALEWDETRGEYYELREWDGEDWTLLDTLEPAERFTLELGRLVSGSYHRYQVAAKDRFGAERSAEEVEFFASTDPLYATIWPIIDKEFYERADDASPSLGKIPGGTTLCVLEEQGDWFQVRYKDKYGYVDSRFCMINLPEYVGDHCVYDITNSYSSVFKVHESPIALVTDQVISGFEHVQTADEQFLAPFLYPCAKKLLSAALAAEKDGYRLKIYEAFRPNEATRFLYDTVAAQLDWAALVPDDEGGAVDPVTGFTVDLSDGLLFDEENDERISREELALRAEEGAESEEADTEGEETEIEGEEGALKAKEPDDMFPVLPERAEEAESRLPDSAFITLPGEDTEDEGGLQPLEPEFSQPEDPGEEEEPTQDYDTYFKIMTNNGRFGLGSFLAKAVSNHNRGVALDLTLEKIDSGEELEMQSAIHDLSWYSATYLNNDNAKLLEKYMTATGMRGLTSEWWHFQDDETRDALSLGSYLYKGVNLGGWTRDERGWRYRDADGAYYQTTAATIDGKRYIFDPDGYASE